MKNEIQMSLSNEQLHRLAPSIFATEAWEGVSSRYTFIPTIDVVDAMRNEGFLPVSAAQSRTRIEGKRDFAKHLIRFRQVESKQMKVAGDSIPEVVLVNSHDRSSGFQLSAGIFRLVCSNGLIVKSTDLGDINVRHSGNIVADTIEGSCRIVNDMPQVLEHIELLRSITLNQKQQEAYAYAAMELRYPRDDMGKITTPILAADLLRARRVADQGSDVWSVFNRVQENFIKGGIRGFGSTGRRMKTRAIKSVNEDVRLNKALWVLTEELARHCS